MAPTDAVLRRPQRPGRRLAPGQARPPGRRAQRLRRAPRVQRHARGRADDGTLVSDTYWTKRQPNHRNFASLLLGNSVTGAASLFRRDLLDDALPLPPRFGNLYHDHWLALVAAATGEIEYVDRPLYDYVQHADAVIGHAGRQPRRRRRQLPAPPRRAARARCRDGCAASGGGSTSASTAGWRCTAVALEQRLGPRLDPSHRRALRLALARRPLPRRARMAHRAPGAPACAATTPAAARPECSAASRGGARVGRGDATDPLNDADLPPEFATGSSASGRMRSRSAQGPRTAPWSQSDSRDVSTPHPSPTPRSAGVTPALEAIA